MDNNSKRSDNNKSSKVRTIVLYALMLAVFIGGLAFIGSRQNKQDEKKYYEVVQCFEQGKVSDYSLNLSNGKLVYKLTGDKKTYEYTVPNVSMFVDDIHDDVIKYNKIPPSL